MVMLRLQDHHKKIACDVMRCDAIALRTAMLSFCENVCKIITKSIIIGVRQRVKRFTKDRITKDPFMIFGSL